MVKNHKKCKTLNYNTNLFILFGVLVNIKMTFDEFWLTLEEREEEKGLTKSIIHLCLFYCIKYEKI